MTDGAHACSQDSGQRLNSFMILSVTESDNQFPGENRDPRIVLDQYWNSVPFVIVCNSTD